MTIFYCLLKFTDNRAGNHRRFSDYAASVTLAIRLFRFIFVIVARQLRIIVFLSRSLLCGRLSNL